MNLRASLVELWTRLNPYDTSKDIYSNGYNDQYSLEMEAVIGNSPTASRARDMMSSFVAGEKLTFDPNMDEFTSLWDIVNQISYDVCTHGGVWVHRSIKLEGSELVTAKIKVLDYHKCKKGKNDDNDFSGKILYGDFSKKSGFGAKKAKEKWFYSYSSSQKVIREQILADAKEKGIEDLQGAIEHYRGQVLYINTTPTNIYAVSPFDSVFNDMDTEYRISLYGNKMFRSGFLGKTMVLFSGLSEEDSTDLEKNIKGWLGSENSDNIYLGEVDNADDVEKSLYIKQLPSQYDDDMSQNTEKRITRNILGAAKNLPEALIFTNESAMFGGSGEMIRELKEFYNSQTASYRSIIEKNLHRLGFNTQIVAHGETVGTEKTEDGTTTERL